MSAIKYLTEIPECCGVCEYIELPYYDCIITCAIHNDPVDPYQWCKMFKRNPDIFFDSMNILPAKVTT